MMPAETSGSVTLKQGKAVITIGTMKEPGFRDCRMTATVDGKSYKHHVKVGFSPENIKPYTQMPKDFKEFWDNNKAEVAKYPLTYTKELAKEYAGKIVIYKVNVDKERELAALFNASSIPLFVFIPMEGEPQLFRGAADKATYQKAIEDFLLKKK